MYNVNISNGNPINFVFFFFKNYQSTYPTTVAIDIVMQLLHYYILYMRIEIIMCLQYDF